MDAMVWLPLVKIVHIGALVVWLGPSSGAWLLLMVARHRYGETGALSTYLYRGYINMLWFQHFGLLTLLASGALLLHLYGYPVGKLLWLKIKLVLVLGVIVPIEIVDIWLGHRRLAQVFSARPAGSPYTAKELQLLKVYHRWFTPVALVLLPIAVIVVMWLAVAKPT